MPAKKKIASALFAVLAACTALSLAALPALADPGKGKGQGQQSKDEASNEASETSASEASQGSSSPSEGASAKGKGSSKKKAGSTSTSGSSAASSSSESSANTPAPDGSSSGKPAHGCDQADAGYTHNYASTCDGSPSLNGQGGGKATGKPCAGCVGAADNKNPKGQFPDGSDANNGYECDGNKGIGKGNPAHTSCKPSTSTPPPPPGCPEGTTMVDGRCVAVQSPCPDGTTMVDGVCLQPDEVLPEVLCPDGSEMVAGTCLRPDEVLPGPPAERAPRVLGAILPLTGASLLSFLGLALGLAGSGTLVLQARKRL